MIRSEIPKSPVLNAMTHSNFIPILTDMYLVQSRLQSGLIIPPNRLVSAELTSYSVTI